jgi:hypothetical protein
LNLLRAQVAHEREKASSAVKDSDVVKASMVALTSEKDAAVHQLITVKSAHDALAMDNALLKQVHTANTFGILELCSTMVIALVWLNSYSLTAFCSNWRREVRSCRKAREPQRT